MAVGRVDYEERKERRINRYEDRAKKSSSEADSLFEKAHDMASAIPFGQPILVGHHSEGADRSYRNRIENTHRKSLKIAEKAAYYQDKAETAANNKNISGDNPDAVNLYQEKLAKLEAAQEEMKAVNKAFAKGDGALNEMGFTDEQIAKMKRNMLSYERKPYPTWALSNNNAEIRRVKEKLEQMSKLDVMEEETITFNGGVLRFNTEINRVQFVFDAIPCEEIRSLLKSRGFKWARSEGAWQRQRTLNAVQVAKSLVAKIKKEEKE